jgi:2-keto-4-pentenoate hydratase
MTPSSQEAAAQFLFAARQRRAPGPRMPEDIRPADFADAHAIQKRVAELLGHPVGGWKCSVPTDTRPVISARIFAPDIVSGSPCAVLPVGDRARIEPEIAFVLGRDLPARGTPYGEDEIRGAIREARFVLELIGPRFVDPGACTFPELVADSIANQGLFVGPVVINPFARHLEEFPVTVRAGNALVAEREGKHPDGHPLRPLYWLANYLAQHGPSLRAGQIVTTGSYCGVLDMPYDTPLTFVYGELGTLSVTFARAR